MKIWTGALPPGPARNYYIWVRCHLGHRYLCFIDGERLCLYCNSSHWYYENIYLNKVTLCA